VASSHDYGISQTEFIAAGSRSHNIFKFFSGFKEVFSLLKLAPSAATGCAKPRTQNL
jgi:hypothetical protein